MSSQPQPNVAEYSTPIWDAASRDQLAEEPSLVSRIHALRMFQRSLGDAHPAVRQDVHELVERAHAALSRTRWVRTAYDAVWRALHEGRHLQCRYGDPHQKLLAAAEIRADIEYHQDKHRLSDRLDEQIRRLRHVDRRNDESIGLELVELSTLAAEEREAAWRKGNRTLQLLSTTSKYLWMGTGALILTLPWALVGQSPTVDWPKGVGEYTVVALCGAVGGLLSGLLNRPGEHRSSIDNHLEQLRVQLRPCIGAISALILRLIVLAGAINVPNGLSSQLLLLAIAAGFSERFVIEQVERISKVRGERAAPASGSRLEQPSNATSAQG